MVFLVLCLLGALLWRIRGGLLNAIFGRANPGGMNDTAVRLVWSFGMAGLWWRFTGSAWWLALILAGAFFAGTTIIGWFNANLSPRTWHDLFLVSLSGTLRMAFIAVVLLSPWPLLAGVMCGPIYFIGGVLPQKPGSWQFWQEWLFGAAIGAAVAASIIHPFVWQGRVMAW